MDHDRLIYVVGAPCSGTSLVAGMLHHLGVDMGEGHWLESSRPYPTFEDARCKEYVAEPTPAQEFIMGGGRDFRAYCEMRLREANGRPCGVKIGAAYWLGDPDPKTLPVRLVHVERPLEDAILSDWKYQVAEGREDSAESRILRAAQMAGYWGAASSLCRFIRPTMGFEYASDLDLPDVFVEQACHYLFPTGSGPTAEQMDRAVDSVTPRR